MLAYVFIGLVALNTALAIYTLWRMRMDNDQVAASVDAVADDLAALGAQLDAVQTQIGKATAEIIAELSNQGSTAAIDAAVAKLQNASGALKAMIAPLQGKVQVLDDLNQDAPVTTPTPETPPDVPPPP